MCNAATRSLSSGRLCRLDELVGSKVTWHHLFIVLRAGTIRKWRRFKEQLPCQLRANIRKYVWLIVWLTAWLAGWLLGDGLIYTSGICFVINCR